MKIDSMIMSMREKSIQKEKQKSDLKLYQEDEKMKPEGHFIPKEESPFRQPEPIFQTKEVSTDTQEQKERVVEKAQIDEQNVFELLEEEIGTLKTKMNAAFRIRQPKEIYESNQIDYDRKSGIFMIDMYRNSLPPAMEEKIKRRSVMDILQAFEISTKELEQDAALKSDALKHELKELKDRVKHEIIEKKNAIKKLEKSITKMKAMISDLESHQQAQTDVIKNEQARIDNALKFMKGRASSKKKSSEKAQDSAD